MVAQPSAGEGGDEYGVPIHIIEKNSKEQIRIGINEYMGHKYIDMRVFYLSPDGFRPSRKGITLNKDLLPELFRGMLLLLDTLGISEDDLFEDGGRDRA